METISYKLDRSFGLIKDRTLNGKNKITLTDDKVLELKIDLPKGYSKRDEYVLFLENGNKKRKLQFNPEWKITIPQELLYSGNLKLKLLHIINGKTVKTWVLEKLILIEKDVNAESFLEVVPEIQEYNKRLDKLYEAVIEMIKENKLKGDIL